MKVIILCGGKGTRLREETEVRPKPLIKIGNKPILWHIMKIYAHYGFNDFALCLGYKGEMIKEYFYHYQILNSDFTIELKNKNIQVHNPSSEDEWKITLVDTGEKSLKGYRIKKIQKYIDSDTFMLTYGDGVADININSLLEFHNRHNKVGTVTGVRPPSRFGEMLVEKIKVVHFTEKPQVSQGLINGGFFVFKKDFFDFLTEDENCDFERGALEELAKKGELMVYEHKGYWECMDNIRDMEHLNKLWETNQAFWKIWR